ncbi:MAG: ATP-binding protein [Nitrospirales bacterium]
MSTFVGRESPVEDIRRAIIDASPKSKVRIISVSGPGGVGKSFMLDHVLSDLDLSHHKYLQLRVDGNTSSATLADVIVRDLIATKCPSLAGDPQYFRVTREGWNHLQWMDVRARAELEARTKDDDDFAQMAGMLFEKAVGLLEIIPNGKTRKASRVLKKLRSRDVERIIAIARRLKAYQEEKGNLFGVLPVGRAAKERNLLRKDLSARLAEYLTIDLAAILSGYRPQDWKRLLPSKVEGMDRCLLILDDYETLEATLDNFLRHDFLPRLKSVKFETLLIVLGRDSLQNVNFSWEQYFGAEIVLDVRLAPLSTQESQAYLKSLGIIELKAMERIIRDSLGLPFLLAAEAECEILGNGSALSLQKFVDRTTRWMTQEQRSWALALSFVEEVNTDTVRCILPDSEPTEVLEWFKKESSIRSPDAGKWTMLPLIRSRLRASVKNDSPGQCRVLEERATKMLHGEL